MVTFNYPMSGLIVDAMKDRVRGADTTPQGHLFYTVMDAVAVEGLDARWRIDREELRAKLIAMTEAEAVDLLERIDAFWAAAPHKSLLSGLIAAKILGENELQF